MVKLSNSGPYTGTGTTYKFGNTPVTVPAQYVISPASTGSDVRSFIAWLNSLGFYYAANNAAPSNPGNSTLVKYGSLYIWIPNTYWNSRDENGSLYNLISSLQTPTGTAPSNTGTPTGTAVSTVTNWITGSTIISGIPNWGIVLGGLIGYKIIKKVIK